MNRRLGAAFAALLAVVVGVLVLVRQGGAPDGPGEDAIVVAGGAGASIPRSTPDGQGLDPASLDGAAATVAASGARALLVARRGHLAFEWYASPADGEQVRSLLLSRLALASLAATPAAADAADDASRVAALSREIWQALDAAPARYATDRDGNPRLDHGLWLRPRDALALATALVEGGAVGGQRLLPPEAAAAVLMAQDDGIAPRGPEPFGARAARLWRDGAGTRLYHFPAQRLVVLVMGVDEARYADETGPAHQILRGIVDTAPAAPPSGTDTLVPSH